MASSMVMVLNMMEPLSVTDTHISILSLYYLVAILKLLEWDWQNLHYNREGRLKGRYETLFIISVKKIMRRTTGVKTKYFFKTWNNLKTPSNQPNYSIKTCWNNIYASMEVCKHGSIHGCKRLGMQVCKHSWIHVY